MRPDPVIEPWSPGEPRRHDGDVIDLPGIGYGIAKKGRCGAPSLLAFSWTGTLRDDIDLPQHRNTSDGEP